MADKENQAPGLSAALVGTWELVSREDFTTGGERRIDPGLGANPTAILFFDKAGNFGAQFMKQGRSSQVEAEAGFAVPNNSKARGGYDAYFGTYTVDEATGNVTTLLKGALSPENVGQVYIRNMRVVDDRLTLRLETVSAAGEPIVRTLKWKRAG
jgi:hypothetical protein